MNTPGIIQSRPDRLPIILRPRPDGGWFIAIGRAYLLLDRDETRELIAHLGEA